ncbi:MAG: SPW repeat protein [Candidatus Paceibacterota bacterium]|jgi:hypothetical protein
MVWNQWVVISLSLWLVISPWILGFSGVNLAVWNNILTGGLIVIMIVWNFVPPEE